MDSERSRVPNASTGSFHIFPMLWELFLSTCI
jgi:hypothetical protein